MASSTTNTAACMLCAALTLGCQGNIAKPSSDTPGVGGSGMPPATGGTGNQPGVGGSSATGGAMATGGSSATGGSTTTGGTGGTLPGAGTGGGGTGGSNPAAACQATQGTLQVGLTRLRRTTRSQLNHTVRDLLGVQGSHSWVGVNQGHHTVSHNDGDNRAALTAIDVWYAEQFAYLLQKLDAVKEGDGTLRNHSWLG